MTNTQNEDLEKLVEQRKQEAKDKQIGYKLRTIVDNLGSVYNNNSTITVASTGIYTKDTIGKYKDNNFSMNYKFEEGTDSDGGAGFYNQSNIKYNNLQVYLETNCEIEKFIPGKWEEEYDKLYDNACIEEEKKEKEKELRQKDLAQKEENEKRDLMKKNFGL